MPKNSRTTTELAKRDALVEQFEAESTRFTDQQVLEVVDKIENRLNYIIRTQAQLEIEQRDLVLALEYIEEGSEVLSSMGRVFRL